jgi:hypothetical protein
MANINKRDTVTVEYNGVTKPLIVWCKELNLKYDTVHDRIFGRNWSVEKAFKTENQRISSFSRKCRERGIKAGTAYARIHRLGWDVEAALNTPTVGRGANQTTYSQTQRFNS